MAEQARFFDGKKFMWDGQEYDSEEKANAARKQYSKNGFEVHVCREEGNVLLYTRRVVTEIVLE
ncbi:MAG TPA: hypothetical protein VMX36_08260 [Sedimentisphaerales bacterium]|nr:hypothetical protein [Sedimentisphaerales bacterium]